MLVYQQGVRGKKEESGETQSANEGGARARAPSLVLLCLPTLSPPPHIRAVLPIVPELLGEVEPVGLELGAQVF